MTAELDSVAMRETTSQPAYIILRGMKGDQAVGPVEWVDGKVEHTFSIDKPNIISGADICHRDGTLIYHIDEMRKVREGETYTISLAVGRSLNA